LPLSSLHAESADMAEGCIVSYLAG
jgi:hypothetical protein